MNECIFDYQHGINLVENRVILLSNKEAINKRQNRKTDIKIFISLLIILVEKTVKTSNNCENVDYASFNTD